MKPAGMFPTAYGVAVPVYKPESQSGDGEVLFRLEHSAVCFGIHDPDTRRRFVEAARGGEKVDITDFGGHPIPRVRLPRPTKAVYPTIPADDLNFPTEAWITLAMDTPRWCDRAAALLDIIGANMDTAQSWSAPPWVIGVGLSQLLTVTLEHLAEQEIDCLEAAALYSLTAHPKWKAAGARWLEPFRETWFRDWRDARRGYRRFASCLIEVSDDIPAWIGGAA